MITHVPIEIPTPVAEKLRRLRERRVKIRTATVVVSGLAALLLAMLMAMGIDWTLTLFDPFWRSALTFTALGTAAVTLVLGCLIAWGKGRQITDLAAEVDHAVPELEERWSTVAELAAAPAVHQRHIHRGMLNQLSQEASALEPRIAPQDVISPRGLLAAVILLSAAVLVVLLALVVDGQQTSVLVRRFWSPTESISMTQIVLSESEYVVAEDEPFPLQAQLTGRPAAEAMLWVRPAAGGDLRQITLVPSGADADQLAHRFKSVAEPFAFRIRAGDGQTDWHDVTIARRPEIAAIRFRVDPPSYTRREPVDLKELPDRVTLVEDSTLEVAVRSRRPVKTAAVKLIDSTSTTGQELSKGADGWYRFRTVVDDSFTLSPILTEPHGLENRYPPVCRVQVYRDRPPTVKVTSPTNELAVRPDDQIEIEFAAQDDFGISRAELIIYDEALDGDGQPMELHVVDVPLHDMQNRKTVNSSVPLDLSPFELEDGRLLSYAVRVFDTRETSDPQTLPPGDTLMSQNRGDVTQGTSSEQGEKSDPSPAEETPVAASNVQQDAQTQVSPTNETAIAESQSPGNQTRNNPANTAARASTNPPLENQDSIATAPPRETPSGPLNPSSPQAGARPDGDDTNGKSVQGATTSPDQPSATKSELVSRTPPSKESPSTANTSAGKQTQPGTSDPKSQKPTAIDKSNKQLASAKPADQSAKPADQAARTSATSARQGVMPAGAENQPDGTPQSANPSPGDDMPKRGLDIAQSTSSNPMRIKIDQWAGSFEGQQRAKLEMAISPLLQELDEHLERSENHSRGLLDHLERSITWEEPQDRRLGQADEALKSAGKTVDKLRGQTKETPYGFIGLQVGEISSTHLDPAGEALWAALQSTAINARTPQIETAWQQIGRARERLRELVTQFNRIRRDHQLAEATQQIKTMYRAFVENSMALLRQEKSPINNYQRSMAEFELDEEYLRRLEEVLKLRQELMAELARILGADPRLMRRFADSFRSQADSFRDQLTLLAERQSQLERELRALAEEEQEDRRQVLLRAITAMKLNESREIANEAAEMQERFLTWLPLDVQTTDRSLDNAKNGLAALAVTALELETLAASWQSSPTSKPSAGSSEEADSKPRAENVGTAGLASIAQKGREVYQQLQALDGQLRQVAPSDARPDMAGFVVRRLADNRRLITRTSAWVHQVELLAEAKYTEAAAVEQYQLATDTEELTGNIVNLEEQLVTLLQREDRTLPRPMAEKARQLLAVMDEQVATAQLRAVFTLRQDDLPIAVRREKEAVEGFAAAETLFDDLFRMAIEEMDKLPVQDPIADLLDDPTLDELLALLENENDLAAALGIPPRPSNLQIIGDWLRPGGGGGGGGMGPPMIMAQIRQQEQDAQRRLQRAYQRALARALKESDRLSQSARQRSGTAAKLSDWNVLVSKLSDELLQSRGELPPEQYRRAIEQYFGEISRELNQDEKP